MILLVASCQGSQDNLPLVGSLGSSTDFIYSFFTKSDIKDFFLYILSIDRCLQWRVASYICNIIKIKFSLTLFLVLNVPSLVFTSFCGSAFWSISKPEIGKEYYWFSYMPQNTINNYTKWYPEKLINKPDKM